MIAFLIWYLIGLIILGYLFWIEDDIKVKDVFKISLLAVFGPILPFLAFLGYLTENETILIKKKKK